MDLSTEECSGKFHIYAVQSYQHCNLSNHKNLIHIDIYIFDIYTYISLLLLESISENYSLMSHLHV